MFFYFDSISLSNNSLNEAKITHQHQEKKSFEIEFPVVFKSNAVE